MMNYFTFDVKNTLDGSDAEVTMLFFTSDNVLLATESLWNNPSLKEKGIINPDNDKWLDLKKLQQYQPKASFVQFLINTDNGTKGDIQLSVKTACITRKNQKKITNKSIDNSCTVQYSAMDLSSFKLFIPFVVYFYNNIQYFNDTKSFKVSNVKFFIAANTNSQMIKWLQLDKNKYINCLKDDKYFNLKYFGKEDMKQLHFKLLKLRENNDGNYYLKGDSSNNKVTLLFFNGSKFLGEEIVSQSSEFIKDAIVESSDSYTLDVNKIHKYYADANKVKFLISNLEQFCLYTKFFELCNGITLVEPVEDIDYDKCSIGIQQTKFEHLRCCIPCQLQINRNGEWKFDKPDIYSTQWFKEYSNEYIEMLEKGGFATSIPTIINFESYQWKNETLQDKKLQLMKLELKQDLIGELSRQEKELQEVLKIELKSLQEAVEYMVAELDEKISLIDDMNELNELNERIEKLENKVDNLDNTVDNHQHKIYGNYY